MATPDSTNWLAEATLRQLERMRSMQYAYHQKFFSWITLVFVLLVVLWVFGGDRAAALVPFLVVTAGVQAAFYLHFCDFARIHASALESRLNALAGRKVLLGAELEADYFYPLPSPKVAGFIPSAPGSFFSVYTLHWCVLWAALFVGALVVVWWSDLPGRLVLVAAAVLWAAANGGYVAWYFLNGGATRRMAARLRDELHRPLPPG